MSHPNEEEARNGKRKIIQTKRPNSHPYYLVKYLANSQLHYTRNLPLAKVQCKA